MKKTVVQFFLLATLAFVASFVSAEINDFNIRANFLLINTDEFLDNESYGLELDYAVSKYITIGPTFNHLAYSGYAKDEFNTAEYSVYGARANYYFENAIKEGFLISLRVETGELLISDYNPTDNITYHGAEDFQRYSVLFSYQQTLNQINILYGIGFLNYSLTEKIKADDSPSYEIINSEYTGTKTVVQLSIGVVF